jgi:hypothetical protein
VPSLIKQLEDRLIMRGDILLENEMFSGDWDS